MIDSNNEIKKLSRGLLDAVRGVMEGSTPKTAKEKDLAAKAPPHDKVTHADVLVGRGVLKKHPKTGKLVTKEETEETIDEAMNAADRFHQHHQTAKDLLKSISQHLSAHAEAAKSSKDYKGKKGPNWGHVGTMEHVAQQLGGIHDMLARQGEYAIHESVELDEAPVDGVAAGSMNNDGHLCATKVFHKEWAEGTPIYSQHAEPDADGNIAWYDVMFEHGIEKMVSTDDLEILMSESHERHGKRKMKEDVEAIDELSNTTLSSYSGKAAKERDTFHANRNKTADAARKYFNRKAGVRKALEKTNEEVEDLEELSTDTLQSYRKKARAQGNAIVDKMKLGGGDWSKDQKDTKTLRKRASGAQMSGKTLRKRGESLKTEDVELDEARGRPRKNPLPAGQSEEPEPRQHIIQQLQRAKLSMRGGEHVTFKDGTKHHVSGAHVEKILAKYSAMKPAGKEEFQKKIGASHAAFKAEL